MPILALAACNVDEPSNVIPDGAIKVVGVPVPFAQGNATKSVMSSDESTIVNMALFVFDSDGNKVDYQFIESSKPLFIIDRQLPPYSSHDQNKMAACKLYILANIPEEDRSALSSLSSEDQFMATDCTIAGVLRESAIRTSGGLPMWGSKTVVDETAATPQYIDLRSSSSALNGSVLQLHLTTFIAKLRFNISLDPIQKSDLVQRFQLKSYTVENIPTLARVQMPASTDESAHRNGPFFSSSFTFGTVDNGVNPVMQGSGSQMSFWCYVPEHKVTPGGNVIYPTDIPEEDKQNFKPNWVTDNDHPIKVTLNGIYTDHRGVEKDVTYTLYPGANNYDDFFVVRNYEYIHNITIKGISNSKEGTGVSLDCRVDVEQNDFTFELERETLLDSHWEIRPIRIILDKDLHPDADRVEVQIMEEGGVTPSWIRFEVPTASQISANPTNYCNVSSGALAYGKRRYFTSDLVTNTLAANTSATVYANDASNTGVTNEHAIWVYVDENTDMPSSPGSTTRRAIVQCRYYVTGQTAPKVIEQYYFIQKSLHNITYNSHTYGIEYYEEYLYNFDAREQYGSTTDGMAWGLNGMQLSYEDRAIYFSEGVATNLVNYFISGIEQDIRVYDFYITKAESADGTIEHPRSGNRFTKRIAQKANFGTLATNAVPQSAVEYCLNKNKRNSDGTVSDIIWYLPAIDEIEDICMGGYADFEVFQDKYYWSSQPAYTVYNWTYQSLENDGSGQMYLDNKSNARATKVANDFSVVHSGQDATTAEYSYSLVRPILSASVNVTGPTSTGNTAKLDAGNQPRTTVNRIRCAYRKLFDYSSLFGFESSTSESVWTSSNFSRNNSQHRTGSYSGYTTSGTATITTTSTIAEPGTLSFWVYRSNTRQSTWTVSVSSNGEDWDTVGSGVGDDQNSWKQITVDLSSYKDVYVRIQTYRSGTTSNRYIDDIDFSYRQ